jgi:hypothetical protein
MTSCLISSIIELCIDRIDRTEPENDPRRDVLRDGRPVGVVAPDGTPDIVEPGGTSVFSLKLPVGEPLDELEEPVELTFSSSLPGRWGSRPPP